MELATERMLADVDHATGIGWVTFNNPERRNAISLDMWEGLATILEAFEQDDSVRVVVMRGAGGKAFVSGADISEFDAKRANAEQRKTYGEVAARANRWLAQLSKPLIALIEGYCIGGGLATALAADVRFASPDSRFGIPAAKLGLGYEFSGLKVLTGLVGPSRAKDIMFTARFLDAAEAERIGLINVVAERDDIEAAVTAYATTVAANAPLTVRAAKAAVNEVMKDPAQRDLAAMAAMVDECFNSDDYREGRLAFREKRTPQFKGH